MRMEACDWLWYLNLEIEREKILHDNQVKGRNEFWI